MFIAYFDEVKHQANAQRFYWVGGLIVEATSIRTIEAEVDALAKSCFGSSTRGRETEFHAAEIFHGKRNFKRRDIETRLTVLRSLANIVGRQDGIGRIYVRLEPARMYFKEPDEVSFIYFVEQVDFYLRTKNGLGLLIGDRENKRVSTVFGEALSRYRESGTPYAYGQKKLESLIDTVHFTESHLSRMLQLADAYVWLLQLCQKESAAYPASALTRYVREQTSLLIAHRYKEWPTDQSWIS
jgi:hypothetical protein